jgi:hypothetical protein
MNPQNPLDVAADALRRIANNKIAGGKGRRSVGQPFYQDKVKNIQKFANQALETIGRAARK